MLKLFINDSKRNYGLDLVRFVAVSMVVTVHGIQELFHIAIPYFWIVPLVGVELFFSLSGFLIGRILLEMLEKEKFAFSDIKKFWIRRWLRILPLYIVLYFFYLIAYNSFLNPVNFDWNYIFFLQNLKVPPAFFIETWSLSIEEWFYLLVPLLILCFYFMLRLLAAPKMADTAFLLASFVLIGTMLLVRYHFYTKEEHYYGLLYRMDAIAFGLIAAYCSKKISGVINLTSIELISSGIGVALLAAFIKMSPDIPDLTRLLYFPLIGIGASLIVYGMYTYTFNKKSSVIIHLSVISYSIYLIHMTGIYVPLSGYTVGLSKTVIGGIWLLSLPLIIIISTMSYKYIELPFLRLRK